ncbi:MAG: hypothetical protein ACI4VF_03545 [Lachnospirales bacterium]
MLNVTDEQKTILEQYIDDVNMYIENDDIENLLIELDDIIIEHGMDMEQEITSSGIELQKIYDQIFNQN